MECKIAVIVLCFGVVLDGSTATAAVLDDNESNINNIARGIDARGMLSSLAGNLMSRGFATTGAGGSQVVSLNLTNLLVLVLLKALIFAAGSLGAGGWKHGGGAGRSNDDGEEKLLSEEEILLFLSYLTGSPGDNGCLQNIACQQPQQAKKYTSAGDILLKASQMFSLDPDRSYQYILQEVDQAAEVGISGGDCARFVCNTNDRKA